MLESHYRDSLSEFFYKEGRPENTDNLGLVIENTELKEKLGIERVEDLVREDDRAVSQAYAGHQFGSFTNLGDGRAHLLGELNYQGQLVDVNLKGSGRTGYSRGGDGRTSLGPMLREYLISEFFAGVGVPTSRSLAVYRTGQPLYRGKEEEGALLVRLMKSHIRVGTFQYAIAMGGHARLEEILDYTIARLYPGSSTLEFFRSVIDRQARLLAQWMALGFVHGVLNTDNVSISGEGFDYGPCAFIDEYKPETVYSSIDTMGRYAYGRQPAVMTWNLARFAECLIQPLKKEGLDLEEITAEVAAFTDSYKVYYRQEMGKKLGISDIDQNDDELLEELLELLEETGYDYHNFFLDLGQGQLGDEAFKAWISKWEARRNTDIVSPQIVPRNHLVQAAVELAGQGDLEFFFDLAEKFKDPYQEVSSGYQEAMPEEMRAGFKTYCGT